MNKNKITNSFRISVFVTFVVLNIIVQPIIHTQIKNLGLKIGSAILCSFASSVLSFALIGAVFKCISKPITIQNENKDAETSKPIQINEEPKEIIVEQTQQPSTSGLGT